MDNNKRLKGLFTNTINEEEENKYEGEHEVGGNMDEIIKPMLAFFGVIGTVRGLYYLINANIPIISQSLGTITTSVLTIISFAGLSLVGLLLLKVVAAVIITGIYSPLFMANMFLIKYRSIRVNYLLRTNTELTQETISKLNKEIGVLYRTNKEASTKIKEAWVII